MPQVKPRPIDNINWHRPCAGWEMNQDIPDEVQVEPQFPLLFGVDGRFPGALRRFKGFRRLDYDIRYPHSQAGYGSAIILHSGPGGSGPMSEGISVYGGTQGRTYVPHNWDGKLARPGSGAPGTFFSPLLTSSYPETSTIYQFIGGTLSRTRRTQGAADRRPLAAFLIHMLDSSGRPVIKLVARGIGDNSLEALFQVSLVNSNLKGYRGTVGDPPRVLDLRLKKTTSDGEIDWPGMCFAGRFIIISHKGDHPDTEESGGDTWIFEAPWKAWRGWVATSSPPKLHDIDQPESEYPSIDNGFMTRGDKFARCKLAGTRGWNWLHTVASDTSPDGAVKNEGWADSGESANITKHEPGNQFRLRIRFINYTTGFVSPMSDPIQMAIGSSSEGVKISWVPGTKFTGVGTTAGAVDYTTLQSTIRHLLMSLFGVDVAALANGNVEGVWGTEDTGENVLTALSQPDTIERDGVYDTRIQIWVTMSVPSDNPSGGGGYYFLDQEIPVCIRRMYTGYAYDPLFTSGANFKLILWPGWLGEPHRGPNLIGGVIPSKGNDELATQDVFLHDSDDVGPLEPCKALTTVSGALVSLSDGGSLSNDPWDSSSGDIRSSPPWKFWPANWIEAVTPRWRHRVEPRGFTVPKFVKTGDIVFLVDQNRIVRIVRDGATLIADDVDFSGGIARDGVTDAGGSILVVTSTGLEEVHPITLRVDRIRQVQRLITEKWESYVRLGNIMSGYDPQLKAIFIAPRRPLTSTSWLRSEALIIWKTTGRVTMLSDVYWVAMTRGVHPVTGKEHLFFIDPAQNITYPDDSLDTDTPGTMVGLNVRDNDPVFGTTDWQRNKVVWTITVSDVTFDADAAFVINGIPFQEGELDSWVKASGTINGIAASINTVINNFLSHVGFNVESSTVTDNVVTITSRLTGTINEQFDFVSLLNIPANITVANTTAGETTLGGGPILAGGGFQGTATTVAANTPGAGYTTVTDSAMDSAKAGSNFDLYAWYNPANALSLGVQPVIPALTGAQVYFFRMVDDIDGTSRPTRIADVRIRTNTQQTFTYLEADVSYHSGVTSLKATDHYCISPVVFQAVCAPLNPGDFPGSGIDQAGAIEALGVYLRNRKGASSSSGTRLPATAPMQGSLFFGVATRTDLENRTLGNVVAPELNLGQNMRLGAGPGKASGLLWNESLMDIVTERMSILGNSIFPVITCYGTDYRFDLTHITGKVTREGGVSGETPEGHS